MAQVLAGFGTGTNAPPSTGSASANSNLGGTALSVLLPVLSNGTATAIYLHSTDVAATRRGAIYTYDGTTTLTSKVRLSSDVTPPTLGAGAYSGWHKYTISPGVAISGANIWVEFLCPGGVYNYTDFNTAGGTTHD